MKDLDLSISFKPSRTNVLHIWAITVIAIFVVALLWFILDAVVTPMYDMQVTNYPTEMSDPGVVFLNAIWTYWPIIVIGGVFVYVAVQSQKRRYEDMR